MQPFWPRKIVSSLLPRCRKHSIVQNVEIELRPHGVEELSESRISQHHEAAVTSDVVEYIGEGSAFRYWFISNLLFCSLSLFCHHFNYSSLSELHTVKMKQLRGNLLMAAITSACSMGFLLFGCEYQNDGSRSERSVGTWLIQCSR